MKSFTSVIVAFLLFTGRLDASTSPIPEIPVYVIEFANKLGLSRDELSTRRMVHVDIKRIVSERGYTETLNTAKEALDDYTGHQYFLIKEDMVAVSIGKRFPLVDGFVVLEVYLVKCEDGFSDAIYSQAYIN